MTPHLINYKQFLAFVGAICACAMTIGGAIPASSIYYPFLAIAATFALINVRKINGLFGWVLLACAASIVINDPPRVFHAWSRFGGFVLVILVATPFLGSTRLNNYRFRLFKYCLYTCGLISVCSFFCYLLGINLMIRGGEVADMQRVGGFGGLCNHSMTLGPVSGLGVLTFLYVWLTHDLSGYKRNMCLCAVFICLFSVMISASRSAFLSTILGASILVFFRYIGHTTKFINITFGIIFSLIALFPVYEPFLDRTLEKQRINNRMGSATASRAEKWEYRIAEFTESPICGVGFAVAKKDYSPKTGTIEPGSSWLAILSMTGLLGAIPILLLVVPTIVILKRRATARSDVNAMLLLALLAYFSVHLIAEGYIFAVGSFLCFMFWLTLGTAVTYIHTHSANQNLII